MPNFTSLVVLAGTVCGAAWGLRVGTKRLHRRSIFDGDEDRGARGWRRRVWQRSLTTVVYATLSALTVLVVMMAMRR